MVKFTITSSIIAVFAAPAAARLSAVNTEFIAQVQELVETAPPTDCERGPGATMLCSANEFCQLDKANTCPSTEHRRFVGTCVPVTMMCTTIWAPVCGCDGETYGSECNANAARVDIKHQGECKEESRVTPTPLAIACPLIYSPVCGCDGQTYDNSCIAEASGTSVCNGKAACKPCPKNMDPVCGANGYTYDNECIAENYGQEVVSQGTCLPGASYCTWSPDDTCYPGGWPACCLDNPATCPAGQPACEVKRCERGASASMFCDDDEFCKLDNSSSCPSTLNRTFKGTCVPAGEGIACPYNWDPVCGCDGQTYGNECAADAAKVDIKHKGECKAEDDQATLQ